MSAQQQQGPETYLSAEEFGVYNALRSYPKRKLNETEILVMFLGNGKYEKRNPETTRPEVVQFSEMQRGKLLDDINANFTVGTPVHELAVKAMDGDAEAKKELLSKYPYAKYVEYLLPNGLMPTGLVLAALDGHPSNTVIQVKQAMAELHEIFKALPESSEGRYVTTPNTPPEYACRSVAKQSGDSALYGITVNPALQKRIDKLFSKKSNLELGANWRLAPAGLFISYQPNHSFKSGTWHLTVWDETRRYNFFM